nr:hypothetical protein [Brevundimonas diminuta]
MTHYVVIFPDDGECTLEAVLCRTGTGAIISSPMEDRLLICATEADAVFIRCGLDLRPVSDTSFLLSGSDQASMSEWLVANGLFQRCEWRALEHFEFMSLAAADRLIEVFIGVTGDTPKVLPLTLWPDVFRSSVRAA